MFFTAFKAKNRTGGPKIGKFEVTGGIHGGAWAQLAAGAV